METFVLLKLVVILLSIIGFFASKYQEFGISRLLTGRISPTPLPDELRSEYFRRVSVFSAAWLIVLTGLCFLGYVLVVDLGYRSSSDMVTATAMFMLGVPVGMAFLGVVGSYAWSVLIKLLGRDRRFLIIEEESHDVT